MAEALHRIGIFGGTFDPIHRTHIAIAQVALEAMRLDEVLFVVSANPPHKGATVFASPEERLELVEAALTDLPGMSASRMEIDREGPSYTADTLSELREQYDQAKFFLIIGQDAMVDLPGWHNPEGILKQARLLVLPRPDVPTTIPETLRGHVDLLSFPKSDLSSTDIRARLAKSEDLQDALPPAVLRVISNKGLYHVR